MRMQKTLLLDFGHLKQAKSQTASCVVRGYKKLGMLAATISLAAIVTTNGAGSVAPNSKRTILTLGTSLDAQVLSSLSRQGANHY